MSFINYKFLYKSKNSDGLLEVVHFGINRQTKESVTNP